MIKKLLSFLGCKVGHASQDRTNQVKPEVPVSRSTQSNSETIVASGVSNDEVAESVAKQLTLSLPDVELVEGLVMRVEDKVHKAWVRSTSSAPIADRAFPILDSSKAGGPFEQSMWGGVPLSGSPYEQFHGFKTSVFVHATSLWFFTCSEEGQRSYCHIVVMNRSTIAKRVPVENTPGEHIVKGFATELHFDVKFIDRSCCRELAMEIFDNCEFRPTQFNRIELAGRLRKLVDDRMIEERYLGKARILAGTADNY